MKKKTEKVLTSSARKLLATQNKLRLLQRNMQDCYGGAAFGEIEIIKTLNAGLQQLERQMKSKGFYEVPKV